jgi:hypothetical protein
MFKRRLVRWALGVGLVLLVVAGVWWFRPEPVNRVNYDSIVNGMTVGQIERLLERQADSHASLGQFGLRSTWISSNGDVSISVILVNDRVAMKYFVDYDLWDMDNWDLYGRVALTVEQKNDYLLRTYSHRPTPLNRLLDRLHAWFDYWRRCD